MPKISVIVPVYKVESYLDRCVESILAQTFEDFELILVDDGSPDNCPALCDAWAEKDSRIKVIHKENGGLSDARNVGFEASAGEWITFIDSDDYVHPAMLQALYGAVAEHGVQVSACGFVKTQGEPLEETPLEAKLWSAEDFYVQRNVNATVAWGKLYRRDTVLPYPKGKLHEDEYVTYRILFACGKIAVIDGALYGYFQNAAGITGSEWKPGRLDVWDALEQQIAFFQEKQLTDIARWRVSVYWKNIGRQMESITAQRTGREQRRYLRVCRSKLNRVLKKYRKLMGYNLLDHSKMYEEAWGNGKFLICAACAVKVGSNRLLMAVLGEKGLAALKRRLGR